MELMEEYLKESKNFERIRGMISERNLEMFSRGALGENSRRISRWFLKISLGTFLKEPTSFYRHITLLPTRSMLSTNRSPFQPVIEYSSLVWESRGKIHHLKLQRAHYSTDDSQRSSKNNYFGNPQLGRNKNTPSRSGDRSLQIMAYRASGVLFPSESFK